MLVGASYRSAASPLVGILESSLPGVHAGRALVGIPHSMPVEGGPSILACSCGERAVGDSKFLLVLGLVLFLFCFAVVCPIQPGASMRIGLV